METKEAIAWFKQTFGARMAPLLEGTPFDADMVAAIANQETGYIWGALAQKGLAEDEILRLCVGDTLDATRGRSCFPRTRAELMAAPRGREMYTIAREALLDMAQHVSGYESAVANEEKFCHGYGIFQYDLQFFAENPDYFLRKAWGDFEACLTQFIAELRAAAQRQGWAGRRTLTDDEKVFVAIAYNKGTADCTRGFKQGHVCDGRCYGENVHEFLHTARSIPTNVITSGLRVVPAPVLRRAAKAAQPAAAPLIKRIGQVFEVNVGESPLRLRSEPCISAPNPGSNVIARLPKGQLVQNVSKGATGDFLEVETMFEGATLRGFAASKFLRLVKRALPVRKSSARGIVSGPEGKVKSKPKGAGGAPLASTMETASAPGIVMDIEQLIRAVQKELGVGVDGKAGPETWRAIYARVTGQKPSTTTAASASTPAAASVKLPKSVTGTVDARSERTIATLQPEVQPYARALVIKAAALGITIKVISGLRTYAEQNDLYAQGRSRPGRVVTNARGGYSNHNFGIAFDIGIFDGATYVDESPRYKAIGALGVELGLEWGGNWKTIKDEPHFQLRPAWAKDKAERDMLAELRSRADSGRKFYP